MTSTTSTVTGLDTGAAAACPVCAGKAYPLPPVDFNKCCEEQRGHALAPSGVAVTYLLCGGCGFCFAPGMHGWTREQFAEHVYNDGYLGVDPDYVDLRPRTNAELVHNTFAALQKGIRHLDFGGGDGLLSRLLVNQGWDSTSWDPFLEPERDIARFGRFNLITAFEVFEHVPDVDALVRTLARLSDRKGIVLFSTLACDGHLRPGQPPSWWYAAPRNGHISLFSRRSLEVLGRRTGFRFGSLNTLMHLYWRDAPKWARDLFGLPKA